MLIIKVIDAERDEINVIHYTAPTSSKSKKVLLSGNNIVMEEVLQISEKIERVQYKDHVRVYSPQNAIQRARSRLDEQNYSMFSNNCESFVNWALTGQDATDQGKAAAVVVAAAAGIAFGVG